MNNNINRHSNLYNFIQREITQIGCQRVLIDTKIGAAAESTMQLHTRCQSLKQRVVTQYADLLPGEADKLNADLDAELSEILSLSATILDPLIQASSTHVNSINSATNAFNRNASREPVGCCRYLLSFCGLFSCCLPPSSEQQPLVTRPESN